MNRAGVHVPNHCAWHLAWPCKARHGRFRLRPHRGLARTAQAAHGRSSDLTDTVVATSSPRWSPSRTQTGTAPPACFKLRHILNSLIKQIHRLLSLDGCGLRRHQERADIVATRARLQPPPTEPAARAVAPRWLPEGPERLARCALASTLAESGQRRLVRSGSGGGGGGWAYWAGGGGAEPLETARLEPTALFEQPLAVLLDRRVESLQVDIMRRDLAQTSRRSELARTATAAALAAAFGRRTPRN